MSYNAIDAWSQYYKDRKGFSYPAEGLIRIFKGNFPDLHMPRPEPGASVLDVGCGDGRNLTLFHTLGMTVTGVEISSDICRVLDQPMRDLGIGVEIAVGHAGNLPFEDDLFDYCVAWDSIYYTSAYSTSFDQHVGEVARVLKPNGWIVCSIPQPTNSIFFDSVPHERPGYRTIGGERSGIRKGENLRCFESWHELEAAFSGPFETLNRAAVQTDWFGVAMHYYVFCARKAVRQ